jgi:hypothetical protein
MSVKNLDCFLICPFFPIFSEMIAVPFLGEFKNLSQRLNITLFNSMSFAPTSDLIFVLEDEHHATGANYVLPCPSHENWEVHQVVRGVTFSPTTSILICSPSAPMVVVIVTLFGCRSAATPKEHHAQFPQYAFLPDRTTKFVGPVENGWIIHIFCLLG